MTLQEHPVWTPDLTMKKLLRQGAHASLGPPILDVTAVGPRCQIIRVSSPWLVCCRIPVPAGEEVMAIRRAFLRNVIVSFRASRMAQQVKNHLQCRRHRKCKFDPWFGKIPWKREWQPTPVFLPEKDPMDRGAWGAIGHGVTKSWTRLGDTCRGDTCSHALSLSRSLETPGEALDLELGGFMFERLGSIH